MAVGIFILIACAIIVVTIMRKGQKSSSRGNVQYRGDRGRYYFEEGNLILNSKTSPQMAFIDDIDHVLFQYDIWTVKNQYKYGIGLTIVKKDGSSVNKVTYQGLSVGEDPLLPEEMAKDLENHGIKCVLPKGKGTIFGNQS